MLRKAINQLQKKSGRILLFLLYNLLIGNVVAQPSTYSLKGTVTDEQNKPVELATVSLNNELATQTKRNGTFLLAGIPKGVYTYNISYVGYVTATGTIEVKTGKEALSVKLKLLGLQLQQVKVTAHQVQMGSKSEVGQEAIRHIQPKTLGDLLQLVPGNLTVNPSLNKLSQAQIREISSNDNNAMGTSVVVDGVPLSNDANLQTLSPVRFGAASSGQSDGMSEQTTAGRGVDLRTVSPGNVESVEVIRGIPSVEYGNLTSGVVIVKTKSGRTPWESKVQVDPFSKLVFAGKGFTLKDGASLNFSLDWAQSWNDTRSHYLGYDRLTGTVGYSSQWGPFSLNAHGSFYSNINNRKRDPQMDQLQLTFKNKNIGARFSLEGNYQPKEAFITKVTYNLSAQMSKTTDQHHDLVSSPDGVITDVRESGIHTATFKNAQYFSDYKIEGKPLNLYGQLTAGKYLQITEHDYTNLKVGAEYTMDANNGNGLMFDMSNPPQAQGTQTLRPRAYKDIPALHTLSGFVSDRLNMQFGTMKGLLEGGARLTNLFLNKEKSGGQNHLFVVEPRINMSLCILNKKNNRFFDDLSLTGGFGVSNKMPTLLYLYPDNAYYDNVSLSKYGNTEADRLALLTTDVVKNTQNPNLKPSNTRKWELGLSFRKGQINGFITYFNENHQHEFGFDSQLLLSQYEKYNVPSTATNLSFNSATGDVTYTADGLQQTAAKTAYTEMLSWNMPSNNTHSQKHGIEYGLDFGTFKPLYTSLSINGAWFHIMRTSETTPLSFINRNYNYVAILPAGEGTIQDRINTTFRLITHIPAIKMIFTTTVQVVWYESEQATYQDHAGKDLYHSITYQNRDYLAVNPLGYYSRDGQYMAWNVQAEQDAVLNQMISRYQTYAFKKDVIDPWALLCFRFTKELGKIGELSFLANNFPNTKKWHMGKYSLAKSQIYPDMYFGAELKIKL